MEITHEFFGREFLISYEIKITGAACPEIGPSYGSGGEPASPCEWEIDGEPEVYSLKLADVPKRRFIDGQFQTVMVKEWVRDEKLDLPDWLSDAVAEWLSESDEVACMAEEMDEEDNGGDPDYRRDCANEDRI
jgi:hypothetical protein